jgi:MFS family permease
VNSSIRNVLFGTFTLRFSTGLTGGLLAFYLGRLPEHGGPEVTAVAFSILYAAFYATELVASPMFGLLSDRIGHHRVMQYGPIFGAVAVTITGLSTNLFVLGGTRVLEGAAAAASIPSILGFLAMATSNNEVLRGKTSARFELATLGGIGAGTVAAGVLFDGIPGVWHGLGPLAFFLNAGIYMISFLIYRYGVNAPDRPPKPDRRENGLQRYVGLLRRSHIWLLAPTWIAVNAAIGVYSGQGLFNLIRIKDPRFVDQLLAGGMSGLEVTVGLIAAGAVFVAGLIYWGNRFNRTRRTTILFYGIVGGAILVVGALAFNHSGNLDPILRSPFAIVAGFGLFVLAGATPAALGLLADMSEAYPDDRGAVMGLYSVFLGVGQILGSLIGGIAAEKAAIDGLLIATLVMMGVALLPLYQLRKYEHSLGAAPPAPA